MQNRIRWIDTARCFGMFAIYLGHCGMSAGRAYEFVFTHHVALFFLIAGCMEANGPNLGIRKTIYKVFSRILLPWLVLCLMSAAVRTVEADGQLMGQLLAIAKGTVRNTFAASGLWFLTCLAVIRVLFSVLRKLRSRGLILLACLVLYYVSQYALTDNPIVAPSMPYNVDSALYYIVYYGIGFVAFPFIRRALEPASWKGKAALALSALVSAGFAVLVFFGENSLRPMERIPYLGNLLPVVTALVIIWAYFIGARLLQNVRIFQQIGQNSLYLCAGEYITKTLFAGVLAVVGLEMELVNPLAAFAYSALMLYLCYRFVVPVERWLVERAWHSLYWLMPKANLRQSSTKRL